MKRSTITYKQLEDVLLSLGYVPTTKSGHRLFLHPKTELFIILPSMRASDAVTPVHVLSVRNTLVNSGVLSAEEADSILHIKGGVPQTDPLTLWHSIIDAEAEYHNQHGHPARVLKLPVLQAYDLAKLGRKDFGPLSERVMREGIRVFEQEGLLGIPVTLIPGGGDFVFE